MRTPVSANSAFGDPPTRDPENTIIRPVKSTGYRAQKLTSAAARSRRKRIEREAIERLDTVRLTPSRRRWAISRIRDARQPTVEAKRIVEHAEREMAAILAGRLDPNGEIDDAPFGLSDVQELRVKLIRRDGIVDTPQAMLLARMDREILTGMMTKERFAHLTTLLFSEAMKPALSKKVRDGMLATR